MPRPNARIESMKMVNAFGREALDALKDRASNMSTSRYKTMRRHIRALLKILTAMEAR